MPENLTTLTTRIRAQLIDDGTLFSTATCTAAVRQALQLFNQAAPVYAVALVDVVSGQLEYELDAVNFPGLLDILDVLEYDALAYDHRPVSFVGYWEDNLPWVRLTAPAGSAQLLVSYTVPHTVDGLDGETVSTMTTGQDQVLVDGACAAAIHIRAASRVETINLAPDVVERYRLSAGHFEAVFNLGLVRYAGRPAARLAPDTRAWNDTWHTWDQ